MLQDKRADLDAEKRKRLIIRLLEDLSRSNGDLYYRPTSEIALQIRKYIETEADLHHEEKVLLEPLDQRDIEVLLSLH